MDDRIELGKIVNTHGLKGEVKIMSWSGDSDEFGKLKTAYVGNDKLQIVNVRYHKKAALVTFAGIDSIEQAEILVNKTVSADREQIGELPEDTYYIDDIIGIEVRTQDGVKIGTLSEVFPTGANDVYVVKREKGKDILLPAIKQVILKTDVENKCMTVHLLEGLVEDEN